MDTPLYILNNEQFALKFNIENNKSSSETLTFTKPSSFQVNLGPNELKTYKVVINKNSVPFELEANNSAG